MAGSSRPRGAPASGRTAICPQGSCQIRSGDAPDRRARPRQRRRLRPLDPRADLRAPRRARPLRADRLRPSAPGRCARSTGFAIVADATGWARSGAPTRSSSPAFEDDRAPSPAARSSPPLRAADRRGARMISICTGAFVLAAAGLLDGRRATTHWRHAAELRARYPEVDVDAARALRRRGPRAHVGRRGRGHRPLPARRRPRPRRGGRQRDRPPDGRRAPSRRRPGAVRRARAAGAPPTTASAATRAWMLERLDAAADRRRDGAPRRPQRALVRPPLPRRDGHARRCAGCTSSASCTPAGCSRRPTCRSRTSPRAAASAPRRPCASTSAAPSHTTPTAYRRAFSAAAR